MTARPAQQADEPRILVIDGNSVFRTSLAAFLKRHQFDVEERASGEEGLGLLESFDPALCVIDLLPAGRMTGVQIAEAMYARDPSLRFVFLSAYLEPAWDERPPFLQSAPLVRKPVNLEKLASIVTRTLPSETSSPPRRVPPSPRGGPGGSLSRAIADPYPSSDGRLRSPAKNSFRTSLPLPPTTHPRFRH